MTSITYSLGDFFLPGCASSDDEAELLAGELRRLVNYDRITEVIDDLVGQFKAEIFVGEFTSTKESCDFNFVAGIKEAVYFFHLNTEIVIADLEPEAHLFHFQGFGSLLIFLSLLGSLVIEFAPIDNLGDWRVGIRGNLNKVKSCIFGGSECFTTRHNA